MPKSDFYFLFFLIKQINHPSVCIGKKYCTNCEPVSRQENNHILSSSMYAEMSGVETDTEEKRQWLSNSCLSIVRTQTAWSAVNTNKFQKGITIKILMFSHSAKNNMEHCYFQDVTSEMTGNRKQEP